MANNAATRDEVQQFLDTMKTRLERLGGQVMYDTRPKNLEFMLAMEWTKPDKKKEWLLKLEAEDYFQGPVTNEKPALNDVWVFGKRIEKHLCYIKIYLAYNPNFYCISFHFAEFDMYLPLKNVTEKHDKNLIK